MFARTKRLTLRPVWPEDAAALAHAIGHETVVMKLSRAPWPYAAADAEAFIAAPKSPGHVFCLILAHEDAANPRLIGGIGLHPSDEGAHELGYWLTPDAWGRGYATEAGSAMVHAAERAWGVRRLVSGHFVDNPASGRVLRKLGFEATGKIVPQFCRARGRDADCARYTLALGAAHPNKDFADVTMPDIARTNDGRVSSIASA